jgi:hypothetical protein
MDLVVAPLEYHEQMKLAETMAYTGMSQSWWRRTLTIGAVRSIDGSKVPRPSDPAHVRDTLRRLGKDGYAQVEVLVKAFRAPGEAPDVTTETLSTLERWELEFMCGDFYDIPAWSGLAYLACTVRSFGGATLAFPENLKELRARVKLLGFHGIGAAALAAQQAVAAPVDEEDDTEA